MAARQKLNLAALNGSLILAGFVGWATQSWVVFVVAALVLLGMSVHGGDIRVKRKGR